MTVTVPNVVGLSVANANAAITTAGLVVGAQTSVLNPNVAVGNVGAQSPAAYSQAASGSAVDLGVSAIALSPNINGTIISQYAQSPVLTQLIENLAEYFDQSANWNNFYQYVWNIDTAQGFGLDFWGKILGVTRYLEVPVSAEYLGLEGSGGTASGFPFGVGVFYDGATATQTYALLDDDYRNLLYAKAFANICRTCIPVMNQILRLLFDGSGDAYVLDDGNMEMRYFLGFTPSVVQLAIMNQSGVIPHPTGVGVTTYTQPILSEADTPILGEGGSDILPG